MFADSARQNPDLIGILFHMEINPSISTTTFTSLDNVSYYLSKEKEILFSMHTGFRIGEMKEIGEDGKELAHLYHQLGYIYSLNNDLANALSHQ
jgi:hypothetical protein